MNWADLARQVIGLGAPLLGTALGGPLGGAAGQILASALLPDPRADAPALRRLDAYLVVAPAWAGLVGLYLAQV